MPHINIRDLGRVRQISAVLVRHGFGQLVRQAGLEVDGEPIDVKLPWARRLRLVLADLGPTFVKLGQVLSVRPDIVPREFIDELELLQDSVPPAPFEEVRAILEEELGATLEERFRAFEPEPMASASIAQVHRAVLADGTEVAVKVQRPGIEAKIRSDLHILYSLAHLITGRLQLPVIYTPVGIVQEFEAAINLELDFLQEARALDRFRTNFADIQHIVAPEVHREWTTRRVLVMELLRGERLGDLRGHARPAAAAMEKLIEATYLQVFEHGFFHGDPHPGNLLVLEDGRLAFLDFGLTGRLTSEMQDVIVSLFLALVYEDAESMTLSLYRAGATDGRVDLKGFKREIERLMIKYRGATLSQLGDPASLVEFIEVASRFRIRLVPEYAVLARTGSILDGIARELLPEVDIVHEVRPYAQRLLGSRLSADRLGSDALRLMQLAQIAMRDVPMQMNQLLTDLEQGSISFEARDPESDLLREELRHAGIRIVLSVVTAALMVSGAVLMAPWNPTPWGIPLQTFLGLGIALTGLALFFAVGAHYLVIARIHPREWRRRASAVWRFFFGKRGG